MRSLVYRKRPFGVMWISAAQRSAVEIVRHDIHRLRQGVFAAVFSDDEHVYRAVQLVHAVGIVVIVVERHMTRACAGCGSHRVLYVRRQFAFLTQVEEADAIFFQARHQQQLIGRVDIGRVRRGQTVDLLKGAPTTPSWPIGLTLAQLPL